MREKCGYKLRNSDVFVNEKMTQNILSDTDSIRNVNSDFEDNF